MEHIKPGELARKLPVGTVTFLFTDIEGSTRLARSLGDRYGEILRRHEDLLREAFHAHDGIEMDTQGDAFFFAFVRARNALAGTIAGQRALAGADWPEGAEVRVRMGLHTGEPSVSDNRYLGLGVHRAARICAAGHGGQILVSPATVAILSDDELADVELRDLGEYRLKDFDEPQRLYQAIVPDLPAEFPPLRVDPAQPSGRRRRTARIALAVAGATLLLTVPPVAWLVIGGGSASEAKAAAAPRLPGAPDCPVFPKSNAWNQPVDKLPVASNSPAIIRSMGLNTGLHADFGSGTYGGGPIGIPYNVVSRKTPRVSLRFLYGDESDKGPYPIPRDVKVEYGQDRHAIMVDRSNCRLYEVYDLRDRHAGSGAVWNLKSNKLRPFGWTSADTAGLPILPGLARWDEVKDGRIDHALRFTVDETRHGFVYPARHYVGRSNDPDLPPMGLRVRLKASVPISGFPRQARVILEALKRYGMLVSDRGRNWYISGVPDSRWSNEDLHTLGTIPGRDFEVVNTESLHP